MTITLGNDAMCSEADVLAAIKRVADSGKISGIIRDDNGNTVGYFGVEKEL